MKIDAIERMRAQVEAAEAAEAAEATELSGVYGTPPVDIVAELRRFLESEK